MCIIIRIILNIVDFLVFDLEELPVFALSEDVKLQTFLTRSNAIFPLSFLNNIFSEIHIKKLNVRINIIRKILCNYANNK